MIKQTLRLAAGIFLIFSTMLSTDVKAQSIELIGGNTLNGALNGALLGTASMAVNNTNDFSYARVGLGAGTLYGMGTGLYDVIKAGADGQYYVSGTFNDGDNSSIIALLDTFYGAAAGSVVATSVTLIRGEHISEGLQYGAGIGAWVGFSFGLIDAFVLSKQPTDFEASANPASASGMVSINGAKNKYSIGLANPTVKTFKKHTGQQIHTTHTFALDMVQLKLNL